MSRYLLWSALVPCAVLALNVATAPAQDNTADVCGVVEVQAALTDSTPPPPRDPRGVLWDNGPFITGSGDGCNGGDTSMIEDGYNIFGYGWQEWVPHHLADDFTVGAAEWELIQGRAYGYQTNSPSESITDLYVSIWDGPPGLGGTKLWGDYVTDRLISVNFIDVYRVNSTSPTSCAGHIQECVFDLSWVPENLSAGTTYWIELSANASQNSYSGPWYVPVVPHRDTDNARQEVAGVWAQLDGNNTTPPPEIEVQDITFIIEGNEVGGCPGDIDGDGDTDHADLGALLAAWCSVQGDPNWNPNADLDGDGHVGHGDLGILLTDWGCGV